MRWPFAGGRERLRRQASDWIAKLNGPHDARDRAAFEHWYCAHPDHAAAYERLAALFETARDIRPSRVAVVDPPRARQGGARRVRFAFAAVAAAACVVLLAFAVLGARQAAPLSRGSAQIAGFAATATESRRIILRDGSEVLLAPGSQIDVAIGGTERRLRLKTGEGRFTVARDARPFIVAADGAEVLARGTQFVVRLGDEGTLVSLIEGRIEVSYPSAANAPKRHVTSLTAGQRLIVPPIRSGLAAATAARGAPPRPAMIAFDDTRLGEAIETMNAHAAEPVRLADPALAERRVTGAFRAGDAAGFAHGIAAALELEVVRPDGGLWLRAPRAAID